jgi:predicted Zn-dependent protease
MPAMRIRAFAPGVVPRIVRLLTVIGLSLLCCLVTSAGWAQGRGRDDRDRAPRISLIRDAEIESLLLSFTTPLFRAAGLDANQLRVRLVKDAALNAFVTSGNRMFVHTGLLQRADSALEVIGVLAHETGHLRNGDPAKLPDMMREAMIRSIGALLIGAAAGAAARDAAPGMAAALGGQSMAMRQFLSFTRAQESGADHTGLQLLERSGWSARGLLQLFGKLRDQELVTVERQDPYLRTHPLTADRVTFVEQHVARSANSNRPLPPALESAFVLVRAKLDGFLEAPVVVHRQYPETDRSSAARYARAIALYRSGRATDAVAQLDGLIREAPGNPWFHELKGQVLFEASRGREAIAAYRDAVRLAPEQPLLRVAYARAMVEAGDMAQVRQALGELQRALDRDRDDTDAWRLLSRAWGKLNDIGQANLALAEEAMINEDIVMARRFAREAEKNLPAGPGRLRAQDIANAVKKENRP